MVKHSSRCLFFLKFVNYWVFQLRKLSPIRIMRIYLLFKRVTGLIHTQRNPTFPEISSQSPPPLLWFKRSQFLRERKRMLKEVPKNQISRIENLFMWSKD